MFWVWKQKIGKIYLIEYKSICKDTIDLTNMPN